MRPFLLLVMVALLLSVSACGSGDASTSDEKSSPAGKSMPNVTGKKLDVAERDIEKSGLDPDDITFVGGGALGPVVKSNWEVCSQVPAAGKPANSELRLTIERSCAGSTTRASSSATPATSSPSTPAVLTAENNRDLATLLKVGDGCDAENASFATKYAGRNIEFDASVAKLANHDGDTTRYDILVAPGDKGPESTRGPNFQFQDVNLTFDLKIKGTNPGTLSEGDKLHLVAEVGEYSTMSCLFALTPVSTSFR